MRMAHRSRELALAEEPRAVLGKLAHPRGMTAGTIWSATKHSPRRDHDPRNHDQSDRSRHIRRGGQLRISPITNPKISNLLAIQPNWPDDSTL